MIENTNPKKMPNFTERFWKQNKISKDNMNPNNSRSEERIEKERTQSYASWALGKDQNNMNKIF